MLDEGRTRTLLLVAHDKVAPVFLALGALHRILVNFSNALIVLKQLREGLLELLQDLVVEPVSARTTPRRTWSSAALSRAPSPAGSSTSVHALHSAQQSASQSREGSAPGSGQTCPSSVVKADAYGVARDILHVRVPCVASRSWRSATARVTRHCTTA